MTRREPLTVIEKERIYFGKLSGKYNGPQKLDTKKGD